MLAVGACASDDDATGGGDAASTTTSAATSTSAPAAEEADAVIAELIEFTEEERGVAFREPVDVELADDEEFERRLLESLEGDRAEIDKAEPRFHALGIIPPDADLYDAMRTLLGAGVVGFYEPETKELVVRGTELSVYTRETVVHELVHALDDQHFDISDPIAPWSDDPGLAVLSAIEGSAERVRAAYVETLSDDERKASTREQLGLAGDDLDALLSLPPGLLDLLGVPYTRGLTFANRVVEETDVATFDRALDDAPPDSMEQILRPAAYLDGEPVAAVEAPEADGPVVEEGVLGEHYLSVLLGGGSGRAVAGWGGDRFVVWRDGDRACLRVNVAMDSGADLDELAEAAEEWAADDDGGDGGDRTASAAGDLVTLTSCT